MNRIGFVGLGNMGMPMSKGLMKDGYEVIGYDLNDKAMVAFHKAGGKIAKNTIELAKQSELVFTSLPSTKAAEAVYLGEDGLLEHCADTTTLVDTSTIAPEMNQKIAEAAKEKGIPFLAAPVSGGVVGAENQTLTVMVGGPKGVYEHVLPVLNVIGGNVFFVNEQIDSGTTVKLINNLLIGFYTAGVSEALHIANKKNIDLDYLFDMMNVSYGQSRIYDRNYNTFIAKNDYRPGFAMKLLLKDLGFAMEVADANELDLPISKALHELYTTVVDEEGYAEKDMAALYERVKLQSEQKEAAK
ncbi:NAD(P)-dependent oxidoreductase [Virgibacillus halophilus]|uniref:NAD(P)-dependent oxidoreductase n=1 Tax=Tigheibacillus halophilus TaxID=361280 RepID=A0ABU5C6N9_9BACI|nr:NAD(P)-dependent oxidoreductase [Virgibacillus halophilus]